MSTTTPQRTIRAIDARDAADIRRCVLTGLASDRIVPQHRQGGAGGRADKHAPANVLWLDSLMNGDIESDADLANVARVRGVKVSLHADPERIPVYFERERAWSLLIGETRGPLTALAAVEMMAAFYGPAYFVAQRDAAVIGWTTAPDSTLVCAAAPAIVCGRGSARVRQVDGLTIDATWEHITCPACIARATGEWS